MSSWERARYIPWDRIPTRTGLSSEFDVEDEKERIFRELQKEAIEEAHLAKVRAENKNGMPTSTLTTPMEQQPSSTDSNGTPIFATNTTTSNNNKVIVPYSHMDLLRQAAFGITLGSVTGSMFGFMDGMKSAGENKVLQKASNVAKFRYLVQGTTRSGLLFGVFFGSFQCLKYGIRIALKDPGDFQEIAIATPISLSIFYFQPIYRPAMPYALMLIGMDCFSLYMRKTS